MPRPVVDPAFGRRLRELREQHGLSLRDLAHLALSSKSHVQEFETGRKVPTVETAQKLDEALGADGKLAGMVHQGVPAFGTSLVPADPIAGELQSALITRRGVGEGTERRCRLPQVERNARAAHDAYQRSDYVTAAQLLPETIAVAEYLARETSGEAQRRAHRGLAVAQLAASKLTAKLGDGSLAWITADRAASAASLGEDPALSGVAAYQTALALLFMPGRLGDAQDVVETAIDVTARTGPAESVDASVRGALLLLGALTAARQADPVTADCRLAAAGQLAETLRVDRNDMWSGFGPTNVLIHRVSVAVELQQPDRAIEIGDHLDTSGMPPALVGRRAQVHLDLASAFAQMRDGDAPAVLHLLETERIAPQVIRVNHVARSLLVTLLERERRVSTPGLRSLAERAGVPC